MTDHAVLSMPPVRQPDLRPVLGRLGPAVPPARPRPRLVSLVRDPDVNGTVLAGSEADGSVEDLELRLVRRLRTEFAPATERRCRALVASATSCPVGVGSAAPVDLKTVAIASRSSPGTRYGSKSSCLVRHVEVGDVAIGARGSDARRRYRGSGHTFSPSPGLVRQQVRKVVEATLEVARREDGICPAYGRSQPPTSVAGSLRTRRLLSKDHGGSSSQCVASGKSQ